MAHSRNEKVLLVVPPFSSVALPNLGVGQLQANLERAGYPTRVLYLNIGFATRIGIEAAQWISNATFGKLLGEFVFSTVLFENSRQRIDDYLGTVLDDVSGLMSFLRQRFPGQTPAQTLSDWCRQAREFCNAEGIAAILASDARIVGFSSSYQQNCAALALIERLKRHKPDAVTVLGGANCSGEMGEELLARFPDIDYVGEGECDRALVSLVERIQAGAATHDIAGIFSRHPLNMRQPSKPLNGAELDAQPYPLFDDYFDTLDRHGLSRQLPAMLAMETSRGCWWGAKHHCTFCGLNQMGMEFRSKSPERALEEIDWLIERYHPQQINVADNILDMQYFKTLLPELAKQKRTTFFYETKANLNREQVRLLAEARINSIQPGIESLSDLSLRLMEKGCSMAQNVQLLKWCAEYGISVGWNYLIGFPGEDEDEINRVAEQIGLLHHLQPPTGHGVLEVDRFSPYYDRPQDYGLAPLALAQAYRQVYPLPDEALKRIAYFFESELLLNKEKSPAVEVVRSMVKRWRSAHKRSYLIVLTRRDALIVIDTRRCARRWVHRLRGLRKAVYEYCDQAHSASSIVRRFAGEAEPQAVSEALDSLVRDRLLLANGDRYLALGVVPERRLTFQDPQPQVLRGQGGNRRTRLRRDVEALGRLLRYPLRTAPRAIMRLAAIRRRWRDRLVQRAVLAAANRYSDKRIKAI